MDDSKGQKKTPKKLKVNWNNANIGHSKADEKSSLFPSWDIGGNDDQQDTVNRDSTLELDTDFEEEFGDGNALDQNSDLDHYEDADDKFYEDPYNDYHRSSDGYDDKEADISSPLEEEVSPSHSAYSFPGNDGRLVTEKTPSGTGKEKKVDNEDIKKGGQKAPPSKKKSKKRRKGRKIVVITVVLVVILIISAFALKMFLTGPNAILDIDNSKTIPNRPPDVNIFATQENILTLEEIELYAEYSDPDGRVVKWEWDIDGDGIFEDNMRTYRNLTAEYLDDGIYNATIFITDNDGAQSNDTLEIEVKNREPTAELQLNAGIALTNNSLYFNATAQDSDGTIKTYIWDFDGDNEPDLNTTEPRVTHAYEDNGKYIVTLTVEDDDGDSIFIRTNVTIENREPTVISESNTSSVYTFEPVEFNATAADPDGNIIKYEWDFDSDGDWDWNSDEEGLTEYYYMDNGTYHAVVRVTDDDLATAESMVIISVSNQGPLADGSVYEDSVSTLEEVTFVSGGYDVDGQIVLYQWDFDGDGFFDWDSETRGPKAVYTYEDDGDFEAVLRVTDDDGAESTDVVMITVNNRAPTAVVELEITEQITYRELEFNGEGHDQDGDIVLYEWDFDGNGEYDWNSDDSPYTTYIYTVGGTYKAALRVTDDDGAISTDTVSVTIEMNRQPEANAGSDQTIDLEDMVTLEGGGSSDPDGHTLEYHWDYGDGGDGDGSTKTHTYIEAGTFTATLTVTDEGGLTDTDTCRITVKSNLITKYAVVVGIADYQGHDSDLNYPDDDADSWDTYLSNKGYTVRKLVDSQATKQNILNEIAWMRGVEDSNSHCVFAYSGHGDYNDGSYILDYAEQGLWDVELGQAFSAFESTHILFVFDCCASGGYDDNLAGPGRYIAEACGINEYSLDDPNLQHGAFTYWFLVNGLRNHPTWSVEDAFDQAYSHCSNDYGYADFHPEERDSDPSNPFYIE